MFDEEKFMFSIKRALKYHSICGFNKNVLKRVQTLTNFYGILKFFLIKIIAITIEN